MCRASPKPSAATARDLDQIVTLLAEPLGRPPTALMVGDLTGPRLREAFAIFAEARSAATVARARSSWSAFLDLLVADGHLAGNPIASVPKTRVPARTPAPIAGWESQSIDQVLTSAAGGDRGGRHDPPERDLAVVALLLGTGCRRSELVGLNLGSIEGKPGARVIRVTGKGDKTRKQRYPGWRPRRTDPLLVAPPPATATPETGSP